MQLSTTLQYAGDAKAILGQAVAYEEAGVDVVWIAEAYGRL